MSWIPDIEMVTNHSQTTRFYSYTKLCYIIVMVFFYVCSTAIFATKKSRVIKFWGFFMYLLFLGIAQTNETWQRSVSKKVSSALGNLLWRDACFLCFLPKGRSIENGITDPQNSLQMRKFKDSKLELFHSLFVLYCAKSWYTVFGSRLPQKDNKPSDVVGCECCFWFV